MATTTLQSNIKKYAKNNITDYSLFLGGLNATQQALVQYDPLRTGYNRIFFVKMPTFMENIMPTETKNFRHLLEYGFTGINGLSNTTLDFEQITGGYAGRQMDVASISKDETNAITLSLYEFSGSPVREYLDMWITGIADPYTGFGTYHGALDDSSSGTGSRTFLEYSQANHVAEAIYVATGPTGRSDSIEYASLLSNMMPKTVRYDQFAYESGRHEVVTMECEFSCIQYRSPQINEIAKALIDRYQVMTDYLDFKSQYTTDDMASRTKHAIINWDDKYNVGAE